MLGGRFTMQALVLLGELRPEFIQGDVAGIFIDSSSVKAHRSASGGKGRSAPRRSAAQGADARPKSMH
jgi:hypothetical protein